MEGRLFNPSVGSYGAISDTHVVDNLPDDDETENTVGDLHLGGRPRQESTNTCAFIDGGSTFSMISRRFRATSLTDTFSRIRSSTLSISMLEKPSDDRKANAIFAGWNVSNLIQGTGILGVPYAVQQGGWAAIVMIFVVALLCCYTGKLLIGLMYETSKKTGIRRRLRVNFPEVGEACFGSRGHVMVSILQSVEMFSGVIMYLVLLGTSYSDLLKLITPHLGLKEWAAINALIVLPSLFITKMSIVSWLSMISVFSLMSAIFVLIIFTFTQIPMWTLSNIPPFNPETFPIGFGVIVFSYTAHAVFPSIEGSMKEPKKFNSMMNYSFLLAAIVKGCLGTFMVLRFGDATAQVATVNLDGHVVYSKLATILVISNVTLAVPLGMFVVSATFDEAFMPHFPMYNRTDWVWLILTRPLLIASALFVAVMVPFFGLIMGVIGSLTGSSLCFLLPCIIHLKLRWDSLTKLQIAIDIAIIIFGVLAGLSGFIFSLKSLVIAMMK